MILKFGRPLPRATPSDCPVQLGHFRDFEHKPALAWSDTDVQALREGILVDAIKALENPRVGANTRSDLLDWIASDEMTPFSFRVCCIAEGLDPDDLRDLLNFRFKRGRQAAQSFTESVQEYHPWAGTFHPDREEHIPGGEVFSRKTRKGT